MEPMYRHTIVPYTAAAVAYTAPFETCSSKFKLSENNTKKLGNFHFLNVINNRRHLVCSSVWPMENLV